MDTTKLKGFTMSEVEATEKRALPNAFLNDLLRDGYTNEQVKEVTGKYRIGTSKKAFGKEYSPIFWQIDKMGNVVNGFLWSLIGNSIELIPLSFPKGREQFKPNSHNHLFGEHLLFEYPGKPVKIYYHVHQAIRAGIQNPETNCLAVLTENVGMQSKIRSKFPGVEWDGDERLSRLFNLR